MGGLSLVDFADPHSSFEDEGVLSENVDLGGESTDSEDDTSAEDRVPLEALALVEDAPEEVSEPETPLDTALPSLQESAEEPAREAVEEDPLVTEEDVCVDLVLCAEAELEADSINQLEPEEVALSTTPIESQETEQSNTSITDTVQAIEIPIKASNLSDSPVHQGPAERTEETTEEREEAPPQEMAIATPQPDKPSLATQEGETIRPISDISPINLDSPMPVARAGPVVIPPVASHLAFSIRAESGSPYRALPSPPKKLVIETDADASVELESLDSPTSTTPLAQKITPNVPASESIAQLPKSQLSKSSTVASSSLMTASVDRPKPLSASVATAVAGKTASTRAFAIRGQLDAAFVGRFGPPQRTVSASSGSSSISSSSRSSGRPGSSLASRTTASGPSRPRPQVTTAKPFSLSSAKPPSKAMAPPSQPAKPSQPKTAPLATRTGQLPQPTRAPLTVRNAPPVFKAPVMVGKPVRPATSSINGTRPMAMATASVGSAGGRHPSPPVQSVPSKRPLASSTASGATLARSINNVSAGGGAPRPALGLPARLVRGTQPGAAPVFSLGVGGGGGTISEAAYASRPIFESPRVKRAYGTPLAVKKVSQYPVLHWTILIIRRWVHPLVDSAHPVGMGDLPRQSPVCPCRLSSRMLPRPKGH